MSILANELIRRLSNINDKENTIEEKIKVVEILIKQLKTSGYNRKKSREAITSGIVGWKRKHQRRKDQGIDFYRSAKSTLGQRCKKKLTDKKTWYKSKRKREDGDEFEDEPREKENEESRHKKKRQKTEKKDEKPSKNKSQPRIKAVLFCPFTPGSILAKRLREAENSLNDLTGYKLKIVERAGSKL